MRSDEELRDAVATLDYELWMVHQAASVLGRGLLGEGSLNNAVVESFGIHARNLVDFFHGGGKKQDDLVARDLVQDASSWDPSPDPLLVETKTKANKLIAHMTYGRKQRKVGGWPTAQVVMRLNSLFLELCRAVDASVLRLIEDQPFLAALKVQLSDSRE